jgi:hypothetical protein
MALGLLSASFPPFEPAQKARPMRHLRRGGNRLGRYGIAAQAFKGTCVYRKLKLGHNGDAVRQGSRGNGLLPAR